MMVRLGRSPNGMVRAPGPLIVASVTRHTPWSESPLGCTATPSLVASARPSAASNNLFTTRLLEGECRTVRGEPAPVETTQAVHWLLLKDGTARPAHE